MTSQEYTAEIQMHAERTCRCSKQGLWPTTYRPVHKPFCFEGFNFPGGAENECLRPYLQWVLNERGGGIAGREVTDKCSFVFQAGSLDGFFSVVASCPIMTLRKMPGRVVKEASKWLFVKFKVTKIQLHSAAQSLSNNIAFKMRIQVTRAIRWLDFFDTYLQ